MKKENKSLTFILDVDGVLTNGEFIYDKKGKVAKIFGAHDSDGLNIIKDRYNIILLVLTKEDLILAKKELKIWDLNYTILKISKDLNL